MEVSREMVQAVPAVATKTMVLPGHIAGGYLTARALLALAHPAISSGQQDIVCIIGILAGILPDSDLIPFFFAQLRKEKNHLESSHDNHRDYWTHLPLVWILISILISISGYVAGNTLIEFISFAILLGTMSHFIFDSIDYGIRWLWPFSKNRFAFTQYPEPAISARKGSLSYYWVYITQFYFKKLTFYFELFFALVAIYVALI